MKTAATRSPLKPWLIAIVPAAALAAAVGAVAARVRDDAADTVTFAVFAFMTFGFVLALGDFATRLVVLQRKEG